MKNIIVQSEAMQSQNQNDEDQDTEFSEYQNSSEKLRMCHLNNMNKLKFHRSSLSIC